MALGLIDGRDQLPSAHPSLDGRPLQGSKTAHPRALTLDALYHCGPSCQPDTEKEATLLPQVALTTIHASAQGLMHCHCPCIHFNLGAVDKSEDFSAISRNHHPPDHLEPTYLFSHWLQTKDKDSTFSSPGDICHHSSEIGR